MNLIDRLRNSVRGLAAQPKPQTDSEIGVSGDFNALYNKEESRADVITIADYRKMLDNDGTVEALYNLLTWPIKAADYHFEVEAGGDQELKLVEENFTLPPHRGGMTLPFDLLIGDMLRAIVEGYRLYEKVWTLQNGKIVYRKLGPRDTETITLKRDRNGGFAGARQRTWDGVNYVNADIPVERCYLFTYSKERSFLYGRSAFKSAHYHYDRKHKLYYLEQLGAQSGAVPGKKMGIPESVANNATKREAALAAAENFGGIESTILLPAGYTLDEYKSNPMDLSKAIAHHDTLIARSILAQFIVLAGSSTGSYSLGESDKENFLQALQGVMNQIEHHVNAYLIPDLINYNFGSGRYPEFKFADISDTNKKIMSDAFTAILGRDDIPGYVIEGIAREVATQLGIEQDETQQTEHQNADANDTINLAEQKYARQLTAAEKRVNLSEVAKKVTSAEERLETASRQFFTGLKDDAVKRLTAMLNKGDLASLKTFTLGNFAPYRKIIEEAMMEQYLYGKRSAADEIAGKIPQTPSKSRQYITQQARAVADKQAADLAFQVKNEVTKELKRANLAETQLGIADVIARVAGLFSLFVDNNVTPGIAVTLAGSLNLGRGDSFGASSDIDRMQYSAILDNRTTRMCKDLDNSVVSYEEYLATKWIPPVHFGCRSIWVAIMKDDSFKPDFRPIPKAPGGYAEPKL